jgi:hypothetical protein
MSEVLPFESNTWRSGITRRRDSWPSMARQAQLLRDRKNRRKPDSLARRPADPLQSLAAQLQLGNYSWKTGAARYSTRNRRSWCAVTTEWRHLFPYVEKLPGLGVPEFQAGPPSRKLSLNFRATGRLSAWATRLAGRTDRSVIDETVGTKKVHYWGRSAPWVATHADSQDKAPFSSDASLLVKPGHSGDCGRQKDSS